MHLVHVDRAVAVNVQRTQVQRARAENPEGSVILISDKGARTGTLVDVMDQVQAGGVGRMAISAEQIGGGG